MQRFVLLADRRSGTTLVIDCLNNLERVHCEKRAFGIEKKIENPDENRHSGMFFLYRQETLGRKLRFYTGRRALIREFLEAEIFAGDAGGDIRDIRGFRLIYPKAEQYGDILECLRDSDTKVIHLVRENVLKTHISFLTAPMHKMHHPREGQEIKTVKLHLDTDNLLAHLKYRMDRIEENRRRIEGFPSLEVSYESFVEDRNAEAARIQPFLGIDDVVPFTTDLVKINPDALDQVIDNYEEVRDLLTGTEYEKFLY